MIPDSSHISNHFSETESHLRRKRMSSIVPKEEDLHGSAQALLRLQDVYELDIREVFHQKTSGSTQPDLKLIYY